MLSPKPLDQIQPNFVCELLTCIGGATTKKKIWPHSLGPGEGPKDQISLNFNYKDNFKDFYTKLCVLSHK